jgi:hypothetical protein
VLLSGVPVDDRQVLQLAGLVGGALGSKIVTAYRLRRGVLALSAGEREQIVAALERAPAAFAEFRRDLLASDSWQPPKRLPTSQPAASPRKTQADDS